MEKGTELVTKNLNELFKEKLNIPEYQRPYEWSRANVLTLLNDIYEELEQMHDINLGTIILHKNNNKYDIVDGQQRLITLALLYNHLSIKCELLDNKIQCVSNTEKRIITNYHEIEEFIDRLKKNKEFSITNFKTYVKKNIKFYVIITENIEESFQLFDGRNSKFKNLDPVDLLKAYHLSGVAEKDIKITLRDWNKNINSPSLLNKNKNKIQFLFNDVLFNIYNWSLNQDRKEFDENYTYLYKGYNAKNKYNYVKYYDSLDNKNFLINKPFKEGKDFFKMIKNFIEKYDEIINNYDLHEKVKTDTNVEYDKQLFNEQYYFINIIYYNALFLFNNKYGKVKEYEKDIIENYIYKWALIHRINSKQVQYPSINKYVLENNFFFECNKAFNISELYKLEFQDLNGEKPTKRNSCLSQTRRKLWEKLK